MNTQAVKDRLERAISETIPGSEQSASLVAAALPLLERRGEEGAAVNLHDAIGIVSALPESLRSSLGDQIFTVLDRFNELKAPEVPPQPAPTDALYESVKSALKRGWEIYNKGQSHVVLDETRDLLDQSGAEIVAQHRQELHALRGWAHYRRGEWTQALDEITLADGHQRAVECHIYILSYAPGYRDDSKIEQLTAQIGQTVSTANAFIIRARLEPSDQVPYDRVEALIHEFEHLGAESPIDVNYANLLHNASRVFFDRSRGQEDLSRAAELISESIKCYGDTDKNLHHRGAAHYWQSRIHESVGNKDGAVEAAVKSLACWQRQVSLETQNPTNFPKYGNAFKHLAEVAKRADRNVADILKDVA